MSTSVGLNFRLTAAVENFERSMSEVNRKLGQIDRSSRETAAGMRVLAAIEIGRTLLSGFSAVANVMSSVASSATEMFNSSRQATDALGKLATSTGMTHEPLQVLTRVADHSGVSTTQFGDALQKLSRGLGEAANGSGTAKRALEQLGIPVSSLIGMAPEQQFMKIAAALEKIEDPAQKSALAADLFGRAGTKLIPMFSDIENSVRGTAKEMLDLGQILSGTQVKNVEAMNDRFSDVLRTVSGLRDQIVANISPALKAMADDALALVKAFEYNGSTGGQALANYLTDAFLNGAKVLADWAEWILNGLKDFLAGFSRVIADLLSAFAGIADYLPGVSQSTVDGLNSAAASVNGFADTLDGFTFNFSGYVKDAIDSFAQSANEAAANTNKFLDGIGKAGEGGVSFADALSDSSLAFGKASPSVERLAASSAKAATAAENTWQPLGTLGHKGSIAAVMMHDLAIKAANAAGSADLTADEVARLGKAAKLAADEMPEPPKAMEMSQQKYAELFAANQEQADILLGMLEEGSKKTFKQSVVDSYMNKWKQQADNLMQIYIRNGRASKEQLEAQYKFEQDLHRSKLEGMNQHSILSKRLETQLRNQLLNDYMKSDALSGSNGIFSDEDPNALPLNEDPGGAFDGIETELSGQTALLDAIRANTENQPIPVVLPA